MKKKWIKRLTVFFAVACFSTLFSACGLWSNGSTDTGSTDGSTSQTQGSTDTGSTGVETSETGSSESSSSGCLETEHAWEEQSRVPETCEEDGYVDYLCTTCGETKRETLPFLGHNVNLKKWEVYEPATLEGKNGTLRRTCDTCNTYYQEKSYSVVNDKENGADGVYLSVGNETFGIFAEYTMTHVVFKVRSSDVIDNEVVRFYLNANGATELVKGQAFMVTASVAYNSVTIASYNDYSGYTGETPATNIEMTAEDTELELRIPYGALGSNYDACKQNNLAFYPTVAVLAELTNYAQNNPFVLQKYAETWLSVNENDKIYYDKSYSERTVENWSRPSFADHDSMFVGVIKEDTVEEAIVAIAIAEQKGASGFDLHLNYLYNNNLLTVAQIEKIAHSTSKPILALNYNSNITHEERTNGLLIGVDGGCAAVDMQGFIYWSGSTLDTQTAENVAYWESKGYDMSFVQASPKETVLDEGTINKQIAYIDQVHNKGAEVLLSAHINTVFTSEQAVSFAEFMAARGVDVVKIVGLGYNKVDVAECIDACQKFQTNEKLENTKVSFHLSGDASVYITRVVCPSFYGSYVAFCWPELTEYQDPGQLDLDMAVACREIAKTHGTQNMPFEDALALLKERCNHWQLQNLIRDYENGVSIIKQAFGESSQMGDRWSVDGNNYQIQLRDANGTNSFNIRAFAYDGLVVKKDMWISADITAAMSPFASADTANPVRAPKVGLFLGNQYKMLAFVYNTKKQTIDLMSLQGGTFGYDNPKGDRLFTTDLIAKRVYKTDVADGGTIRMAIHKTETAIELYFAEGEAGFTKVAEVPLTSEVLALFDNDGGACTAGVLAEVFMGSASVGSVNSIHYVLSYDEVSDILTEVPLNMTGYAYGASSEMSDRWTIDGENCYMELRNASGTNTFNIRTLAYDDSICQEDIWISADITADMSPFVSDVRIPKVGVYLGTKEKMLAFVYNTNTKTIDLVKTGENAFSYDSPTGDKLSTTGLIENTAYTTDVAGGGTIRMAIHKTKTAIELYFAEGTAEYQKVAEIALTADIFAMFENTNGACYAGILSETYMGSSSKGKVNSITYKVSYKELA